MFFIFYYMQPDSAQSKVCLLTIIYFVCIWNFANLLGALFINDQLLVRLRIAATYGRVALRMSEPPTRRDNCSLHIRLKHHHNFTLLYKSDII